jgi:hypothetical protein
MILLDLVFFRNQLLGFVDLTLILTELLIEALFHLYGGFKKKSASISNFVKISVRSTKPNN